MIIYFFFQARSRTACSYLVSISNLFHFYTTPNVFSVSQSACMYENNFKFKTLTLFPLNYFYTTSNVIIVSQSACMYGNYSDLISDYNFSFRIQAMPSRKGPIGA